MSDDTPPTAFPKGDSFPVQPGPEHARTVDKPVHPTADSGSTVQLPAQRVSSPSGMGENSAARSPIPRSAGITLDRRKLAAEVAAHSRGLSESTALQLVDTVFAEIVAALRRDGDVTVPGFGRFKTGRRVARKGWNPNTRQPINIPPKSVV